MNEHHAAEEWRPVVGYEGRYEVSNLGRVRTVPRQGRRKFIPGKPRKLSELSTGYLNVQLCDGSSVKNHLVHRLVLSAFVGPCPNGMMACHGDGNRKNNHVSNLRWDTATANQHDRRAHGTLACGWSSATAKPPEHWRRLLAAAPKQRNSGKGNLKLSSGDCEAIRELFTSGRSRPPVSDIAKQYGVCRAAIYSLVSGQIRNSG